MIEHDNPPSAAPLPHSALYFGDTRNHWWNGDYLRLLGQRLRLAETRSLLDVGCGVGHWGRLLLPLCHPEARLTGVDREAQWVKAASSAAPDPARCAYREADLHHLPFADESFALVTCQTVLIHVADPRAALAELTRVLAPGGWLLFAEPNNLAGRAAALLGDPCVPLETALSVLRLQARCERGKAALGLGNNSIGETLLGQLDRERFDEVHAWQCDRPFVLLPPYREPSGRAALEEALQFAERDIWIWPKEETRRYYVAGVEVSAGAEASDPAQSFEADWRQAMEVERSRVQRLLRRELSEMGGHLLYLLAARKA
jgi:SAM-dependent methyltransferase